MCAFHLCVCSQRHRWIPQCHRDHTQRWCWNAQPNGGVQVYGIPRRCGQRCLGLVCSACGACSARAAVPAVASVSLATTAWHAHEVRALFFLLAQSLQFPPVRFIHFRTYSFSIPSFCFTLTVPKIKNHRIMDGVLFCCTMEKIGLLVVRGHKSYVQACVSSSR